MFRSSTPIERARGVFASQNNEKIKSQHVLLNNIDTYEKLAKD